jgi:hypothetical protein
MRRYSRTEITRLEAEGRLLPEERRCMIRDVLQRAYEIMVATPEASRPHRFADGVAAAIVQDCRRYPTERQAWWISELHRQCR